MRAASTALLAAVLLATASVLPGAERDQLARDLEAAIEAPGWGGDRWSVLVVSLENDDTLFSHQAEAVVPPASNLKLFTTAAALRYLGPDYRYSTFLTGTGPVREGVLEGDLVVFGTGDPTLSDRFFDSKTAVWEALADSLRAVGVRRIAGDVVGDASYFQGPGIGRGWQRNYVTHTYAAPASALSFNDNVVTMRVLPADETGQPPTIQLIPGGRVELRNEATTSGSGRSRIRVEREDYDAPLVVTGSIRRGASAQWRAVPVSDPASYAASVFAEVLEERGIAVDGGYRSIRADSASLVTGQSVFAPATDEDPVIQVLAVHRSPPLLEILKVINQRSHNLYAESVLRTVGRVAVGRGSVEGGAAAVQTLLEAAGPAGAAVRMDDGSGLSVLDRASARSIVELLDYMAASPYAEAFMATLPEAATSRGLRRMQRTDAAGNLRAKTGTIDRVSALSGYVRARNGELLAFSILSHDVPSTWTAKRVEDRIGSRLASFDRPVPATATRMAAPDSASEPRAPRAVAETTPDSAEPGPGASPAAATGGGSPADEDQTDARSYVIKPGDTLEGIARKTGTTVSALREANPGVNPRRLIPGRTIRLPGS